MFVVSSPSNKYSLSLPSQISLTLQLTLTSTSTSHTSIMTVPAAAVPKQIATETSLSNTSKPAVAHAIKEVKAEVVRVEGADEERERKTNECA